MSTLSGVDLCAALDRCETELEQAIEVLRLAGHSEQLPLSEGDRVLLRLAEDATGRPLELVKTCKGCGETNTVSLEAAQVRPHDPRCAWLDPACGVREPTYRDLIDLPEDESAALGELFARCLLGGSADSMPADDQLRTAFEIVDGSLSGPILLTCVGCGTRLAIPIDLEQVCLERLREAADHVDLEVHLLASAYGWDLPTIEQLPDHRRHRLATFIEQAR